MPTLQKQTRNHSNVCQISTLILIAKDINKPSKVFLTGTYSSMRPVVKTP